MKKHIANATRKMVQKAQEMKNADVFYFWLLRLILSGMLWIILIFAYLYKCDLNGIPTATYFPPLISLPNDLQGVIIPLADLWLTISLLFFMAAFFGSDNHRVSNAIRVAKLAFSASMFCFGALYATSGTLLLSQSHFNWWAIYMFLLSVTILHLVETFIAHFWFWLHNDAYEKGRKFNSITSSLDNDRLKITWTVIAAILGWMFAIK